MMSPDQRILYFRKAPHDTYLVFVPPERALYVDQLHRAIKESSTWGEFRKRLPAGEYQKLYEDQFSDDPAFIEEHEDAREPADNDGFSAECVPGYSDGDYPPWLAAEQGQYLPLEVLKEFSSRADSAINGSFWRLDATQVAAIVERLTNLGYKIEQRNDLKFW
jgi:hypothetical protein